MRQGYWVMEKVVVWLKTAEGGYGGGSVRCRREGGGGFYEE